jgi:acetyl-CoA acyltransferase
LFNSIWLLYDLLKSKGQKALADAGITFDKIEQAFVGYVYGE